MEKLGRPAVLRHYRHRRRQVEWATAMAKPRGVQSLEVTCRVCCVEEPAGNVIGSNDEEGATHSEHKARNQEVDDGNAWMYTSNDRPQWLQAYTTVQNVTGTPRYR